MSNPVEQAIRSKLSAGLEPAHLDIRNESSMHNVPPGSESHFRVVVVTGRFDEQSRVQRHRTVHALLSEELDGPVHALAIEAHTPQEWEARSGAITQSPACLGGSKHDRGA